jgi:hypothetical protein
MAIGEVSSINHLFIHSFQLAAISKWLELGSWDWAYFLHLFKLFPDFTISISNRQHLPLPKTKQIRSPTHESACSMKLLIQFYNFTSYFWEEKEIVRKTLRTDERQIPFQRRYNHERNTCIPKASFQIIFQIYRLFYALLKRIPKRNFAKVGQFTTDTFLWFKNHWKWLKESGLYFFG